MMRASLIALALLASGPAAAQTASFDWFNYSGISPTDNAPIFDKREYRNPILSGFYPDPSITRVGDDFYLVTSTFSYFPGIPVFHSRDLVSWTQIGNAIDRPEQLDFKKLGLSRGVFAPSIQAKDGVFYILNTCVDCGGNFVITATNPAGPWSDPVWLPDLEGGIDPSLFFDDDGRTWIVNNGPPEGTPEYQGHRAIWVQEFDLKALKTVGPRKVLVNGGVDFAKKPIWIEGPHILKRDGWYYLICAEGGTAEGHSQVVLRAQSVTGPYEPNPANPILTQRDLPRDRPNPVTSAGHAQLVETANGEWWASFLAVRPYTGDFYVTGRETFLMPVRWENGWPRITFPGEAIPPVHWRPDLPRSAPPPVQTSGSFGVHEDFDGPKLPPYWMMLRNPREPWYALKGGKLELRARPEGLGDNANPSFLARRVQHMRASAETQMRFTPKHEGDVAGIVALQSDDNWFLFGVTKEGGATRLTIRRRSGPKDPAEGVELSSMLPEIEPGAPVILGIGVDGGKVTFSLGKGLGAGDMHASVPVGLIVTDDLSTKVAGGFVGAVFGVYAHSGKAAGALKK